MAPLQQTPWFIQLGHFNVSPSLIDFWRDVPSREGVGPETLVYLRNRLPDGSIDPRLPESPIALRGDHLRHFNQVDRSRLTARTFMAGGEMPTAAPPASATSATNATTSHAVRGRPRKTAASRSRSHKKAVAATAGTTAG